MTRRAELAIAAAIAIIAGMGLVAVTDPQPAPRRQEGGLPFAADVDLEARLVGPRASRSAARDVPPAPAPAPTTSTSSTSTTRPSATPATMTPTTPAPASYGYGGAYLGEFRVTCYSPAEGFPHGQGTASGAPVGDGSLAGDPHVLGPVRARRPLRLGPPLNLDVRFEDTGGAVHGHHVDLWRPSCRGWDNPTATLYTR